MAGEGLFFLFFWKQYFIGVFFSVFFFFSPSSLTRIRIVMTCRLQILGLTVFTFFFPSLRRGDGTLKRVPSHVPVGVAEGSGSECQNGKPDPQPWSWETLWSSGWLLTTERGSQHGVGVVGEGHTRVLNNGWAAMCSPGLISFFFLFFCFCSVFWGVGTSCLMTEQNYPEGVQLRTSGLDRATLKIYNFVALYPNRIQAYVCCKIFTC